MKPLPEEFYGKIIFFAGCESNKLKDELIYANCENVLVSYYHLRNKSKDHARKSLAPFKRVILDSGGFTFIQRMSAGETISNQEIIDFNKEYIQFCDEMKDVFNWVFEFDMNVQISEQYRIDSIKEMNYRGIRVVPIVHDLTNIKEVEEKGFFDYDLIALAGKLTGNAMAGPIITFFNECRKRGVMVHGLAATDEQSIMSAPYASVDSSSWLAGARYGCTYIFQNGRLKVFDKNKKAERKRFRSYIEEAGINYENLAADTAFEVNCLNAYSWRKWQEFIQFDTRQSYWLSEMEKAEGKKLRALQFRIKDKIDPVETLEDIARDLERSSVNLVKVSEAQDNFQFIDSRIVAPMHCNNCYLAHRCDKFKEDSTCYFKTLYAITEAKDILPVASSLITMQMDRIAHGRLVEKTDGGNLDRALSREIQSMFKMAQQYVEINETILAIEEAQKELAPAGGNILKAIFEEVPEDQDDSPSQEQELPQTRKAEEIFFDAEVEGSDNPEVWDGDLFK